MTIPEDFSVQRLANAVVASDLKLVRSILEVRPELVHMDMAGDDERRALHFAVLDRAPEMVRLLMEHGADARKGIYPHRSATSAWTLATERDYGEIAEIIRATEQARPVETANEEEGSTEASSTERAAVESGNIEWLRSRHAEGRLTNALDGDGGMLTAAVEHDQPEILSMLLDFGFDANERVRVAGLEQPVFTSGMPLWHCARLGRHAMAETLLNRGADPNAQVYASGSPVFTAYGVRDWKMVALLKEHGGTVGPLAAGLYRETELARKMLAGEISPNLEEGMFAGKTLAEQLLWAAACGGDTEIVRLALERVDWPQEDHRWHRILEQPARFWNHMGGHWAQPSWNRDTYAECFGMVLKHCDPNTQGRFGLSMLHDISASREHVTAAERAAFATMLLDAGASLDTRDDLLKSTPLGWACRWGREELVRLFIERGADVNESEAEAWATPRAWAAKREHAGVVALLSASGAN